MDIREDRGRNGADLTVHKCTRVHTVLVIRVRVGTGMTEGGININYCMTGITVRLWQPEKRLWTGFHYFVL